MNIYDIRERRKTLPLKNNLFVIDQMITVNENDQRKYLLFVKLSACYSYRNKIDKMAKC